ncbi:hypothetical protein RVR_3204 [Actinacidiphila reveromycinica]|uniref:Uncharacterized protein n=1 Tax=Actinacidiphila reveromycinica TaxID=659352 RepID=A0A7U3URJ0_9ACTN|nr:hypothetical protein RVR_3204 [Streptomyces sp. SN-593]
MNAEKGKERANQTRKETAAVYWKLYNSLDAPASTSGGAGYFTSCGKSGSSSVQYVVRALIRATSDKKMTYASLEQTVADQLAAAGWHLTPSEDGRSAEKSGITVELELPSVGAGPTTALQVESGCVDVGAAKDTVSDGYSFNSDWDQYKDADASASPVPTTFPSAD